jgi:hypothetical protein
MRIRIPRLNRKTIGVAALLVASALSVGVMRSTVRKGCLSEGSNASSVARLSAVPPIILWAWERPEQLDFIDPTRVGVAFLSQTLYLRGDQVVAQPRRQPLNVPSGTRLIAVTRIEVDRSPALSSEQINRVVQKIGEVARSPEVIGVQVDFDATRSQQKFYHDMLVALRRALPGSTGLSITALASWCQGDNWMSDLPLDEAVPMLFRMGIERRQILSQLSSGANFNSTLCRNSAGISTDEPLTFIPRSARIYVFNTKPWSSSAMQKVMETYQR